MDFLTPQLAIQIAAILAAGGAAWGSVKVTLNGTKQRVKNLEDGIKDMRASDLDTKERLARIETKIDLALSARITGE